MVLLLPPLVLMTVVTIGIGAQSTRPAPTVSASARVVAVARTAPASSGVALVVPVDRINKFVIDDRVRGRALRITVRVRAVFVPRAT